MSDINEKIAGLSPEQRARLMQKLKEKKTEARPVVPGITPRGRDPNRFPLSFSQERMWFYEHMSPGTSLYNMPYAFRLKGPLDEAALCRALQALVDRHEVFRTKYREIDGLPVQEITDQAALDVPLIDLSQEDPTRWEFELRRHFEQETHRPFDLEHDLMLRPVLLRLGPEDHLLILTIHHIASDGWSMEIVLDELAVLYRAFSQGQPSPLPDLPIQYADVAAWQREWLEGDELERQMAFWKRQLDGAPQVLELLTDHPRTGAETPQGSHRTIILPAELVADLEATAQAEGATMFMLCLAAFSLLMSRYTRQEELLIGTPVAGRTRREIEGLVGFFVNTLVMRCDLGGDPAFREYLGRVRKTTLSALSHQDVPFEKLVGELSPQRELGRMPLVQVLFLLQTVAGQEETLDLPGMDVQLYELAGEPDAAQADLFLEMAPLSDGRMLANMEFNSDIFEAASIDRMLEHLQVLLRGISANPGQSVSELPLLTEAERHQLLVTWNDTARDYPRDICIHQLVQDQATRAPEATAVTFDGQHISYGELDQQANQLAHYLSKQGVEPGRLVAVFTERCLEIMPALLGVLKAGCAYVPVDTSYPQERVNFMLEDTGASVLLTQEALLPRLPEYQGRVICLDRDWPRIGQESKTDPEIDVKPDDLAYVIYTSGSSGQPKGVMVEHQSVNRLVINTDYIQIEPEDVMAQISNASFDAAVWEMWGALLNGAHLVIIPKDVMLSPREFVKTLRREKVSVMTITVAVFNLVVSEMPDGFKTLRYLDFGADAANPQAVRQVLRHGPPTELLNVYGPTEAGVNATWYPVGRVPKNALSIPIGRPIANTTAYILDQHLQPVPIGVPGEIYLGSPGLARGYLNRPELTEKAFIADPFQDEPGTHLYKTGDLARFLPDGNIEFLGRIDFQVKIRGFRIELGEVEAALSRHPGLREATVIVREDHPGDRQLVAYVVPEGERVPAPAQLQDLLRKSLPDYMVPSAFVPLDALPLTGNGKVDRRALPVPDISQIEERGEIVAPRDNLERQMVGIWENVLDRHPIGVTDNFFEIGGHSLLAAYLAAQIEKVTGKKFPLASIFQAPTIEQFVSFLRQEGQQTLWNWLVPVQTSGSRPPLFAVHSRTAFVYRLAHAVGPDQPIYGLEEQAAAVESPFHYRIKSMASDYIQEVRSVQPEGPYYLTGYCFGAIVAYEMAQQLLAQGQKIGLLALLDVDAPGYDEPISAELNRHRGKMQGLGIAGTATYLVERFKNMTSYLGLQVAHWFYNTIGRPIPRSVRGVTRADFHAIQIEREYDIRPYPELITLYHGIRQGQNGGDPYMGWKQFAQDGIDLHQVPGGHELVVEPYMDGTAEDLRDCLLAAQEKTKERE